MPETQGPGRRLAAAKHLTVVSIIAAALSAGLVYVFLHFSLIPRPASVERGSIDHLMKVLFAIAAVIFSLIGSVFSYTLIVFRRRRGDSADGPPMRGHAPLEVTWTLVPLIIVVSLAAYAGGVLSDMTNPGPPQAAMEVDVTAVRFGWQFQYPQYGGFSSFELRLPVDRKVMLHMQSKDVVHSFWVQEFGPKEDLVPGMMTMLVLTPTKIGHYLVQCSQLCGAGHTFMVAPVSVTTLADFQSWALDQQIKQQKK